MQLLLSVLAKRQLASLQEIGLLFGRIFKALAAADFGVRKFHMCDIPLLRLDKKTQADVDEKRLRTGTATVNELRKQYDMPAVKDGDIVYVLTNLAELGSPKLRDVAGGGRPAADATGTEADGGKADGNEEDKK